MGLAPTARTTRCKLASAFSSAFVLLACSSWAAAPRRQILPISRTVSTSKNNKPTVRPTSNATLRLRTYTSSSLPTRNRVEKQNFLVAAVDWPVDHLAGLAVELPTVSLLFVLLNDAVDLRHVSRFGLPLQQHRITRAIVPAQRCFHLCLLFCS